MSKRHKLDFQALIRNDVAPAVTESRDVSAPAPAPVVALPQPAPVAAPKAAKKGTLKERTRPQSLYLEIPVHEALREIAFVERTSMHALFLEGIDAVLKRRGAPSIAEMLRKSS